MIRSYRLHLSVALHCALLGPVACGGNSEDTDAASTTDASTTTGTDGTDGTTAAEPTTGTPEPTTTAGPTSTTDDSTTGDLTTESAPTTGEDATSTGDTTDVDPPMSACEGFCATHDLCCTPEEQCQFDAACVATCEQELKEAELIGADCRSLHEDVHNCAAADCTTFIEYKVNFDGECSEKELAAWNDPACALPVPPECVDACANIAMCDRELDTADCEAECSSDLFNAKVRRDPVCEQTLKDLYMCIAGLTCEQFEMEEGCEPPPENCG